MSDITKYEDKMKKSVASLEEEYSSISTSVTLRVPLFSSRYAPVKAGISSFIVPE